MISIGDRLDNKYVVTRRLGGGGFGEVFLADDEAIPGRQVAVKVLSQPRDADHSDLLWEMQALAKFNHPHVVAFYHHFRSENCLHLVMEFCPGGSLEDRLRATGGCPEEQAFGWGLELCETLAFVHGKGIVHHDIKPMNILFAADGTIKVGDFGIANRNAGTRLYLPPEVRLGEQVSRIDPRIDVYALGLTLLESITGRHPFEDLRPDEVVPAQIAQRFVPRDMPRWAQEILLKATHPTPELRFQSADDFAEAIRARHVAYVFDGNHIKADAQARRAESAMARRRWKTAQSLASSALQARPDCVAALLAAGRCQLLIHHVDRASEYFSKAVAISPRTPVQKELGWISLEQGRLPTAISLLTDHLQRNASDYEAYNLLLKCFYLTDRLEAGESLARALIGERAPNDCFRSNLLLFRFLDENCNFDELRELICRGPTNPFIAHNMVVRTEKPSAWGKEGQPPVKSKLLFEEYRFGTARRGGRRNTLAIYLPLPDGARRTFARPIVTIGWLGSNDVVFSNTGVSRRHCVIVNYPDDVWLYDLGSASGTVVDSHNVVGRVFLNGVHEVVVGPARFRIAANSELLI